MFTREKSYMKSRGDYIRMGRSIRNRSLQHTAQQLGISITALPAEAANALWEEQADEFFNMREQKTQGR